MQKIIEIDYWVKIIVVTCNNELLLCKYLNREILRKCKNNSNYLHFIHIDVVYDIDSKDKLLLTKFKSQFQL